MGNHLSCISAASAFHDLHSATCSSAPAHLSVPRIRVLHAVTRAITELEEPITAAEVMMEFPGHFVFCYSSSTSAINRSHLCTAAGAVPADDKLRPSELYVLLPMHRLNGRLSEQEMVSFSSHLTIISSPKKSLQPEISICEYIEGRHPLRSSSAIMDAQSDHQPVAISMCRSKSWLPKLETIAEARAVF